MKPSSLLLLFLASSLAHAEVVNLGIGKTRYFDQTSRTITQLHDFSISAFIGGSGLDATMPSSNNRFSPPNGGTFNLGFQSGYGGWYFEDFFADQSALNAAHANGTYSFLVGSSPPISISLPSDAYPNVPVVESSAGGWIGGLLCLGAPSAAGGFQLTTNVSNGSGFLTLEIFDDNNNRLLNEVIQVNINHDQRLVVVVPPGLIVPGRLYSVEVEFDNVVSTTPLSSSTHPWASSSPVGTVAFGLFSSRTYLEIYAVTNPTQQFEVFTARNELSPAQSTTGATPFSDGVPNLLKYAFNMNGSRVDVAVLEPGVGESGLPKIVRPSSGVFRFEFLRRVGSGLIYNPQKSSSLQSPSWQPLTAVPTVVPINAEWERVVYEEPYDPMLTPLLFGRVEVILPP